MKIKLILISKTLLLALTSVVQAAKTDTSSLKAEWATMNASKESAMVEFNEAKFGMFIHWGIYSVPAGIWNGKKIPKLGEWIFYRAQIPRAEYRAIASEFNPVHFDAKEWVQIAKDAGMRYMVAMPKHHDGFAMYDSKVSDFDIVDATPFGRDPIQELYEECQKQGLRFGIYYSHSVDWMDGGDANKLETPVTGPTKRAWPANHWDPAPVSFDEYIQNKGLPQVRELLTNMPDIMEIWYDISGDMTAEQSFQFYKAAYDLQPNCLINSRVGNGMGDFVIPGDNVIPDDKKLARMKLWETPGTLNNTWGYKSYDVDWKSTDELVFWIISIASKGGNYLLNIGPKPDGTIPEESITSLQDIGRWMKINGEAIYGTTRWEVSKEGPTNLDVSGTQHREEHGFENNFTAEDIWFTTKGNSIFALSMKWPESDQVLIKSLNKSKVNNIQQVSLLGSDQELTWKQAEDGLSVNLPKDGELNEHGYVLKIDL